MQLNGDRQQQDLGRSGPAHLKHSGGNCPHDSISANSSLCYSSDSGRDVDVEAFRQDDKAGQIHCQQSCEKGLHSRHMLNLARRDLQ